MKKTIKAMAIIFTILSMSGCSEKQKELINEPFNQSQDVSNEESENTSFPIMEKKNYGEEINSEMPSYDDENALAGMKIEAKKTIKGDLIVFITNNNDFLIPDLELQVVFYKAGEIVGIDKDGHDALIPSNTVVSKIDAPDSYDDYEISSTLDWNIGSNYSNWTHNIDFQPNIGEGNDIIVQFKNLGEVDISELEYIVVFYKGGDIVDTSSAKDIHNFKAKSEIVEKILSYSIDFDSYSIYINQAHTFDTERRNEEKVQGELSPNIGKLFLKNDNVFIPETRGETQEIKSDATIGNQEQDSSISISQKNAIAKAKEYLKVSAFSYSRLIRQLEYEKFTHEEAVYGADNCGADWNEQAVKKARDYLDLMSFSKERLIGQLEYEGFTHEQAVYGAEQNGY